MILIRQLVLLVVHFIYLSTFTASTFIIDIVDYGRIIFDSALKRIGNGCEDIVLMPIKLTAKKQLMQQIEEAEDLFALADNILSDNRSLIFVQFLFLCKKSLDKTLIAKQRDSHISRVFQRNLLIQDKDFEWSSISRFDLVIFGWRGRQ